MGDEVKAEGHGPQAVLHALHHPFTRFFDGTTRSRTQWVEITFPSRKQANQYGFSHGPFNFF